MKRWVRWSLWIGGVLLALALTQNFWRYEYSFPDGMRVVRIDRLTGAVEIVVPTYAR